jgi:hypothetical protein
MSQVFIFQMFAIQLLGPVVVVGLSYADGPHAAYDFS